MPMLKDLINSQPSSPFRAPRHSADGPFRQDGGRRQGSVNSGAACCPACHTSVATDPAGAAL